MEIRTFEQKIYEAVQNTLKTEYCNTHCNVSAPESHHHSGNAGEQSDKQTSFADLVAYLTGKNYAPAEVSETDSDGFVKHVYYDFDVLKRYMVLKDSELAASMAAVGSRVSTIEDHFASRMSLYTTELDAEGNVITSSNSVNHSGNDNSSYCHMRIEPGNKISNTWTCPATGNLVVYGWLDSSDALNNKSIPTSYCAIEANINGTESSSNWEVIGVQPVIPAKNITYVGFNLPVKKDLVIRARTGFLVGAKSGQFSNDNDGYDTLSNNVPNGFRCMIFSSDGYNPEQEAEQQ